MAPFPDIFQYLSSELPNLQAYNHILKLRDREEAGAWLGLKDAYVYLVWRDAVSYIGR